MAKDSVHQAGERAFEQAAEGQQEPDPAADTGLSYEELKARTRAQEDDIDETNRRVTDAGTDQ